MRQDPHFADAVIEYGHHLVHQGKLAFLSDAQSGVASVTYLITTGAKPLHLAGRVTMSVAGTAQLTEGLSAGADGVAIVPSFYNRVENRKMLSTFSRTPTGTAGGTALLAQNVPATPTVMPLGVRQGVEFKLLPNTKYLLTLTPGASANVTVDLDLYEESPGDR